MEKGQSRILAAIPAYNEEDTIGKIIFHAWKFVSDVLVCDDGSKDKTRQIALELGARVVSHSQNQGKGAAIRTLSKEIIEISPDIIVTLDADGQHDPLEIPMLLKPIEAGESDLVIGSRYVEGSACDAPVYRRLGLLVINWLYKNLGNVRVEDTQSGFRAYTKKAFLSLLECDADGYGIEGEQLVLASKNGLRIMEVPVTITYNGLKSSKKSPVVQGIDLIVTILRLKTNGNSKK